MPKKSQPILNERGVIPVLVLIAVVGVLLFLAVSVFGNFKGGLFASLYNRTHLTFASGPIQTPRPISGNFMDDQFTRADSTTSMALDNPSVPADLRNIWTYDHATFGIQNDQSYVVTGCPAPGYALVNGASEGSTSVTLVVNPQDARIPFRYQDSNNMYWVEHNGAGYVIDRFLNGVKTQLASNLTFKPANGDRVAVTYQGSLISVTVNGQSIMSANDSAINGTRSGIGTWCNSSVRFDDFSLRPISTGPFVSANWDLKTGWNYFVDPFVSTDPTQPITAQKTLNAFLIWAENASPKNTFAEIAKWDGSTWQTAVIDRTNNRIAGDFPLLPGYGYYFNTNQAVSLPMSGHLPTSDPVIPLRNGWNLVGVPTVSSGKTAADLFNSLAAQGFNPVEVAYWNGQSWQTYLGNNLGTKFALSFSQPYAVFVQTTTVKNWTADVNTSWPTASIKSFKRPSLPAITPKVAN